jgi:hypothetical protein
LTRAVPDCHQTVAVYTFPIFADFVADYAANFAAVIAAEFIADFAAVFIVNFRQTVSVNG